MSDRPLMPYALQLEQLGVPIIPLPGGTTDSAPCLAVYVGDDSTTTRSSGGLKPAVVVCPGGGYGYLANDHEGAQVARWYTSRGFVAFVLHYRLGPKYHHPVEISDAHAAISWVRDHATEYGIDSHKVGIMGFSAGGHLAASAAILADTPVRPDYLVLGYPVITLLEPFTHMGSRNNLLGEGASDELAASLSVERQVTAQAPATFIFHTEDDGAVPIENAVMLHSALRSKGVSSEIHIYAHGPHGVGLSLSDPALGTWPDLLERWLRRKGIIGW